jgi:hypothetical protein
VSLIYDAIPEYHEASFDGVRPLTDRLCLALTGRRADPAAIVAAKVVLSGIATVVLDSDEDATALRPLLVGVARRALTPRPDED